MENRKHYYNGQRRGGKNRRYYNHHHKSFKNKYHDNDTLFRVKKQEDKENNVYQNETFHNTESFNNVDNHVENNDIDETFKDVLNEDDSQNNDNSTIENNLQDTLNNNVNRNTNISAHEKIDENFKDVLNEENFKKQKSYFEKYPLIGQVVAAVVLIVLIFGVTYAVYNFYKTDTRQADIVAGEVYVRVRDANLPLQLSLTKLYPSRVKDARARTDNYVDFTIDGKNTSLNNSVFYKFSLVDGEEIEGKTKINPNYLMFDLSTLDQSDNETIIVNAASMTEFNKMDLDYINYVAAGTTIEQSVKYRLRMWISEDVLISDTDPNKTYTNTQFNNLYANINFNISTDLSGKSIPLIIQNNRPTYVNGKSVINTSITNFYDLNEEGESLADADSIEYVVSNSTNVVYFTYTDSKSNSNLSNSSSLDLNYTFAVNENITHQIMMTSQNGETVNAPISFKIYKNGRLLKEYTQIVTVVGNNYCVNNGFTKLSDCILVSENNYNSVSLAKREIEAKGPIDVSTTAPAYTDNEHTIIDPNSQLGLYAAEDNQGTSYIYRGDVLNNNVSFAGLKWKIVRINGDGSIRLIFDPYNVSSNSNLINSAYNTVSSGPTYVGYMYNEESSPWETASAAVNNIDTSATFYWADSYKTVLDDAGNTVFVLDSYMKPMVQMTFTDMKTDFDTNGLNSQLYKTQYTCFSSSVDSCISLWRVLDITGTNSATASLVTLSPNSTNAEVVEANVKSSTAKKALDNWYQQVFSLLENNGKLATSYVVDNIWCNNRGIYSGSYPYTTIFYSDYGRIRYDNVSSLKCAKLNDTFSYNINNGNGKLTYPVGLITADELAMAGAKYGEVNPKFYLNKQWVRIATMTPYSIWEGGGRSYYFFYQDSYGLYSTTVDVANHLLPVINLSKDVVITSGNGEDSTPYVIK